MRICTGLDFQTQCILYGKQQNSDCAVCIAVKRTLVTFEQLATKLGLCIFILFTPFSYWTCFESHNFSLTFFVKSTNFCKNRGFRALLFGQTLFKLCVWGSVLAESFCPHPFRTFWTAATPLVGRKKHVQSLRVAVAVNRSVWALLRLTATVTYFSQILFMMFTKGWWRALSFSLLNAIFRNLLSAVKWYRLNIGSICGVMTALIKNICARLYALWRYNDVVVKLSKINTFFCIHGYSSGYNSDCHKN